MLMTKPGRNGFRDLYFVRCRYDEGGCGGEGGWRHSKEEAVNAWNKRDGKPRLIIDGEDFSYILKNKYIERRNKNGRRKQHS